jgi:hypothetical protein
LPPKAGHEPGDLITYRWRPLRTARFRWRVDQRGPGLAWRIVGGRRCPDGRVREDAFAVLAAEPDNPYDTNAVTVWIQGLKVGYLSREDAQRYRPGLLALEQQHGQPIALAGVIAGGGMRADGPGRLGVFLDHNPADFGLRPLPVSPPSGSRMRTGLSDALATDEVDESYDLVWLRDLPVDELRAIKMLRQLLERETDAIDRHFMHAHLEALLYRSRDVFASALITVVLVAGLVVLIRLCAGLMVGRARHRHLWDRLCSTRSGPGPAEACGLLQRELNPQPRTPRPRPVRSEQPDIEVLICSACGRQFQRFPMPCGPNTYPPVEDALGVPVIRDQSRCLPSEDGDPSSDTLSLRCSTQGSTRSLRAAAALISEGIGTQDRTSQR